MVSLIKIFLEKNNNKVEFSLFFSSKKLKIIWNLQIQGFKVFCIQNPFLDPFCIYKEKRKNFFYNVLHHNRLVS